MKRNRSTLVGASLAALAMMIIVLGCSSSNPVAPQTSGIEFENPQYTDGYPQVDPNQPGVHADRDNSTEEPFLTSTPDIVELPEGEQVNIDAERVDDAVLY
jgi:hypothetical protein